MKRVEFTIPVRTVSEANQREHWRVRLDRKRRQQSDTFLCMRKAMGRRRIETPCHVLLTRHGAKMLDSDNLAGSFKHVQDEIARGLSVDDGDTAQVRFEYAQVANGKRDYSVRVEIKSATSDASEEE